MILQQFSSWRRLKKVKKLMTYGKCAAYGREWSQGQHCYCPKGPNITTWICPSAGSQQQDGLGSTASLAPLGSPTSLDLHGQIRSTSNASSALRERDIVQLNCGALI